MNLVVPTPIPAAPIFLHPNSIMRLNQYIAHCGVASRRSAEALITDGLVKINGVVVKDLGRQVELGSDSVQVRGRVVKPPNRLIYIALHKPAGFDVTRGDPHSQKNIFELLPPRLHESVQSAGRLDRPTTGLLILTNDGDLNARLTHPRYGIEKEYLVFSSGPPREDQLQRLRRGIMLEDGFARAVSVERTGGGAGPSRGVGRGKRTRAEARRQRGEPRTKFAGLRIIMHQGRNRIVRRMCEAVGFHVTLLHRPRVGPVQLRDLKVGAYRQLGVREIEALKRAVGMSGAKPNARAGSARPAASGGKGAKPAAKPREKRAVKKGGSSAAKTKRSARQGPAKKKTSRAPAKKTVRTQPTKSKPRKRGPDKKVARKKSPLKQRPG